MGFSFPINHTTKYYLKTMDQCQVYTRIITAIRHVYRKKNSRIIHLLLQQLTISMMKCIFRTVAGGPQLTLLNQESGKLCSMTEPYATSIRIILKVLNSSQRLLDGQPQCLIAYFKTYFVSSKMSWKAWPLETNGIVNWQFWSYAVGFECVLICRFRIFWYLSRSVLINLQR